MNTGLFYCDIAGTFDGGNDRDAELNKFFNHLEVLCDIKNLDRMIFSFATGDESVTYLFDFVKEVKAHTDNSKIILGKQFMQTGCYSGDANQLGQYDSINKGKELCHYVNELMATTNLKWLGYANDAISINTIEILRNSIGVLYPNIDIYGFMPSAIDDVISDTSISSRKKGINGLNDSLAKRLFIEVNGVEKVYAKTGTYDK